MHTREFINGRWVNSFTYNRVDLKERLKEEKVEQWDSKVFEDAFAKFPRSCSMAAQYIKQRRWSK